MQRGTDTEYYGTIASWMRTGSMGLKCTWIVMVSVQHQMLAEREREREKVGEMVRDRRERERRCEM
jgi:hypothetical protein